MSNPWDPLPLSTKGESTPEPILIRIGQAITAWEMLEYFLSSIFKDIVTCGLCWPGSAERAYGTVISFAGRSEMLAAAIDASLLFKKDSDLKRALNELTNKSKGYSGRRNQIAHGSLVHWTESGRELGYFWMPPSYSAVQHRYKEMELPVPKSRFGLIELDFYIAEFQKLRVEAMELTRLLSGHLAELRQSFERKTKR